MEKCYNYAQPAQKAEFLIKMGGTKETLSRAIFTGSLLLGSWLGSGCAEKKEIECPRPISTPTIKGPTRLRPLLLPEWQVPSDESYREEIYAKHRDLFEVLKWERPTEVILDEAIDYLKNQLRENCGPSAENWLPRIEELKGKTYFLEPYMFLIERHFPQEGEEKEKLIDKYQQDRKQAIIDLSFRIVDRRWGADNELFFNQGYDLETGKILINLGQVDDEIGRDILLREFWRGLPGRYIYQDESGDWYRVSGFLPEKWNDDFKTWLPIHIGQGIYSGFEINEAFVNLMEPGYVGPFWREHKLIERAFEVFGRNKVISLYLQSNPKEFYRLILENCDQFSEFLEEGTTCPVK